MGIIKLKAHTQKIKLWTLTSSRTHPSTPRPRLRKVCTACHLNVKQTPILSPSSTVGRQIWLPESKTLPMLGRKEQWFFLSSVLGTSKCHSLELIGWLRTWCRGTWLVFSVTSAFSSVPEKVASSMIGAFWHSKLFCMSPGGPCLPENSMGRASSEWAQLLWVGLLPFALSSPEPLKTPQKATHLVTPTFLSQ